MNSTGRLLASWVVSVLQLSTSFTVGFEDFLYVSVYGPYQTDAFCVVSVDCKSLVTGTWCIRWVKGDTLKKNAV